MLLGLVGSHLVDEVHLLGLLEALEGVLDGACPFEEDSSGDALVRTESLELDDVLVLLAQGLLHLGHARDELDFVPHDLGLWK